MRSRFGLSLVVAAVTSASTLLIPAQAVAAPNAACTFTPPSAGRTEARPSCVAADVSLDRLPAVGESATVTVAIRSQVALDQAALAVRLPDNLKLDARSSGLSATRVVGLSQVADQKFALSTKGRTLTFGVTAVAPGPVNIEADVTDQAAPAADRSAHASATLTVGDRAGTSRQGVSGTESTAVTRSTPAGFAATAAAGQVCGKGSLTYSDAAGAWKPGRNAKVQLVGRTTSSAAAAVYATGLSSATDGSYSLCFTSPVTTMYQVWTVFTADSNLWRVTDNNGSAAYTVATAAKTNVVGGTTLDFGASAPTSTYTRAWHVFDTLTKLWAAHGTSACWTARESSNCTRITLHWQPGSTDGTYFQNGVPVGQRYIALTDADPDSEHTVLHESGHALMDLLYAGWWPESDCPSPHYVHLKSGASCAWTEGFANAVAGYVMGDGKYKWSNGASIDLMSTTPFDSTKAASVTNMENGETVEGRVAGAIIDLWRKVDNGPLTTFADMISYPSTTFKEWFTIDRPAGGLDVSGTTRDLVYTHTIDYRTGGTPTGIVTNGGFENGTTGWTVTGGSVGNWTTRAAQAGSWYAWLGGNGSANTDTVSQKITIPSTAKTATLGYYLRVITWESGTTAYDTLKVQVVDGTTTSTLKTWSNADASSAYGYKTLDLSAYKGKTVTLLFTSVEDSNLETDFLVDTIAVTTT
ncbi:hypothetical protein [Actinosynnema sp. NPDC020468]|uniref:hypothetical protein n=1 Tax=Actinosynnema sp. NPDC020468 TaxID=3154488 RepID=UPI0033DE76A3